MQKKRLEFSFTAVVYLRLCAYLHTCVCLCVCFCAGGSVVSCRDAGVPFRGWFSRRPPVRQRGNGRQNKPVLVAGEVPNLKLTAVVFSRPSFRGVGGWVGGLLASGTGEVVSVLLSAD